MDHIAIEESYLTYYKFLDGIDMPVSYIMGTGCDLSFNEGITAGYLLSRGELSSVYVPAPKDGSYASGLKPLDVSSGLVSGLRKIRCDYVISVGGTFNLMPIDETACAVYNCLRQGGKFLFGVFPFLLDDEGRDILDVYGKECSLGINKKLNRWFNALNISFGRYFPDIKSNYLMASASSSEIKDFFKANAIYGFICKSDEDYEKFFGKLGDRSRLYMLWRVLSGEKK